MQQPEGEQVRQQPRYGDDQHRGTHHRLRCEETPYRLPQDEYHDHQQRRGVEEGRQGGEAQIAEGVARVGLALGEVHRHQGHQQRGGIGQHMAGVGQQRQRAGQQATDYLGHHKDGGD